MSESQKDRITRLEEALRTVERHSLLEIRKAAFAPPIGSRMNEPYRAGIADACRRLEDFVRETLRA